MNDTSTCCQTVGDRIDFDSVGPVSILANVSQLVQVVSFTHTHTQIVGQHELTNLFFCRIKAAVDAFNFKNLVKFETQHLALTVPRTRTNSRGAFLFIWLKFVRSADAQSM